MNATLKEVFEDNSAILVTAGYGDVFRKGVHGPGVYTVCTCCPASGPGYEFGHGQVTVTQADLDEALASKHGCKTLPVQLRD